jgi:hypothetical protein
MFVLLADTLISYYLLVLLAMLFRQIRLDVAIILCIMASIIITFFYLLGFELNSSYFRL